MIFTPNSAEFYLKLESHSNWNGSSGILFRNRIHLTHILLYLLEYKEEMAYLFQSGFFCARDPDLNAVIQSFHEFIRRESFRKLFEWRLTLYFD